MYYATFWAIFSQTNLVALGHLVIDHFASSRWLSSRPASSSSGHSGEKRFVEPCGLAFSTDSL
jgi:hypothetical protein